MDIGVTCMQFKNSWDFYKKIGIFFNETFYLWTHLLELHRFPKTKPLISQGCEGKCWGEVTTVWITLSPTPPTISGTMETPSVYSLVNDLCRNWLYLLLLCPFTTKRNIDFTLTACLPRMADVLIFIYEWIWKTNKLSQRYCTRWGKFNGIW